jgi:hypothetical protein
MKKNFSSLWPLIKGIKQIQFIKLPPQPCVKSRDESNEVFDRMIRGWLCSITVTNHQLIMIIRFVAQSYTHTWKKIANKLHLVLHTNKIVTPDFP